MEMGEYFAKYGVIRLIFLPINLAKFVGIFLFFMTGGLQIHITSLSKKGSGESEKNCFFINSYYYLFRLC